MEMINHQRDSYKWEFVFLGANQDAIQAGGSIGVAAASSVTFSATGVGVRNILRSTSKNLAAYMCGQSVNMQYSAQDRAEAEEK